MQNFTEKFDRLSYRELQKAAKSRGINAGGKRNEILSRLRQNENAVQVSTPKTSSSSDRPPSGKENGNHALPRKARIMAFDEGSPHLPKKALGQISLNSPRVNQRMLPHKKKPLFSPALAAEKSAAFNAELFDAAEASPASASAPGLQAFQEVSPSGSGVVGKEKKIVFDERVSAEAASTDQEVESRAAAVMRGRSSMVAATANFHLQDMSGISPGTIISAKLVTEDKGEQCAPEMSGDQPSAVADTTIDKGAGVSVALAAAADIADAPVCKKFFEHQQQKEEGGLVAEAPAKVLPRVVKSSLQQGENTPPVDNQRDQIVLTFVEKEAVDEASGSTVKKVGGAKEKVPSREPAHTSKHSRELVSVHRLGADQENTLAVIIAAEDQDRQQRKSEITVAGMGAPIANIAQQENLMVMQKNQEESDVSKAPPQPEVAGDAALFSPTKGKRDVISISPDDIARVSLPKMEVTVVTKDSAKMIAEGGAGAGAVVQKRTAGGRLSEGNIVASDVLPHNGLVVDKDTKTLVEGSKHLHFEEHQRIVRCTLTGKKLAPDYVGILKYITSRRVQQLMVEGPFFMSDYEGMFLVEDPVDPGFVFCELTGMRLFKSKAAVDQHINGEPFKEMVALIRAKFDA